MNKLICPSCLFPFNQTPSNCFDGNVLECPHCRRNAAIIFKGRVMEHGMVIISGVKMLISSKSARK